MADILGALLGGGGGGGGGQRAPTTTVSITAPAASATGCNPAAACVIPVRNPSFENTQQQRQIWENAFAKNDSTGRFRATNNLVSARSGSIYYEITFTDQGGTFLLQQNAAVCPGTKYDVNAWISTQTLGEAIAANCFIQFSVDGNEIFTYKPEAGDNDEEGSGTGEARWVPYDGQWMGTNANSPDDPGTVEIYASCEPQPRPAPGQLAAPRRAPIKLNLDDVYLYAPAYPTQPADSL